MKPNTLIDDAVRRFDYDQSWVSMGALTEEIARNQLQAIAIPGADQSIEHYRYGAWRTYFYQREQVEFSEAEFRLLVEVAKSELNKDLGGAVFGDLVRNGYLTNEQLQELAKTHSSISFDREVYRETIKRRLSEKANDNDIVEIINSGNTVLQRWLIDNIKMSKPNTVLLSEITEAKAVRNLARIAASKL